jgi:hypothetical protein
LDFDLCLLSLLVPARIGVIKWVRHGWVLSDIAYRARLDVRFVVGALPPETRGGASHLADRQTLASLFLPAPVRPA